ncbi:hypothetical protein [Flavobacterium gilvum]|uniref:Uncharacterized protein n=1 Tax=Flavobacterium gilvum TaxID=1492737 RepID=A0AAC9I554_9FLAO|nr:hypothetical protein [Flavobacterium gilvum]AOW09870.1 hypothetical protein EM308_10325 [Flavobacterium gilvum]KFC58587.1 hypothetical protein FEM08_26380 [Flavobacterium gilvum]
MKKITFLIAALAVSATHSYAQLKITKIKDNDKDHYIANVIGYPITGIYNYVNKTEPLTILNSDGTGMMQNEDLVKENIVWGIECSQSGVPIFKEGFNSASYSLWYRVTGSAKSKADDGNNWIVQSFSIHYNKRKMFIAGERVKEYIED